MRTAIKVSLYTSFGVVCSVAALLIYRYWKREKGPYCLCKNRAAGKVIAITGANSGIGYELALDLAKKGAILYLGCRNEKKGLETVSEIKKKSGNPRVHYIHLDLTNFTSCKLFSRKLHRLEENLDVLLNVAGVFHQPASLTSDGFDVTLQTNFLGVIALTDCLLGLLEVNRNSRIIFVSSEAHRMITLKEIKEFDPHRIGPSSVEFWDHVHHYGVSKLALKLYASHISVTRPTLKITSVNPGNVWTNIHRRSFQSWSQLHIRLGAELLLRSPHNGMQSVLHAVNVPNYTTGGYISDCVETERELSEEHLATAAELIKKCRELIPKTSF